MKFLSQHKEPF